jgi:uncharacterized membrane protein YedE/YeeE
MKYLFLPLGALFGFLLSRGGATTYDFYAKLFLFQDLQLLWVIATAIVVGVPLLQLLKRFKVRALLSGEPIEFQPKPMKPDLLAGSLVLGVGWGLTAACPGTVLVMLGEGKLAGLFTISGILLGTWLYGKRQEQRLDPGFSLKAPPEAGS